MVEWVRSQLPPEPARLLEVGCGKGDLARALDRAGYDVVAIDPAAPEGPIFRRLKLEDVSEDERFDTVVSVLALHHVDDLEVALDRITGLLRPGGTLVLVEFASDRLDLATAQWFHQLQGDRGTLEGCRREWEDEHAGLHGYGAMRPALDVRFQERSFAWTPYLYRLLDGAIDEAEEQTLIDAETIQALGFRYVGARR